MTIRSGRPRSTDGLVRIERLTGRAWLGRHHKPQLNQRWGLAVPRCAVGRAVRGLYPGWFCFAVIELVRVHQMNVARPRGRLAEILPTVIRVRVWLAVRHPGRQILADEPIVNALQVNTVAVAAEAIQISERL